ncbi:(deoxy)nucleoside triphosphate pyrophosphohydrolase [Thermodesulfobacteriota bacterium]
MQKKKPITVTAAVIWEDGKFLITQRPGGVHLEGLWEFPGGKKKEMETLEQCMEREIMEELGIKIRIEKELFEVLHEYESKVVELHFFQCVITEGIASPREGQNMRWIEPFEISRYKFPSPDRKIVEHIAGQTGKVQGLEGAE